MLQVEREIVQRENAYASNEIDNRRLEQLHSHLNSFNLQATLIVGFALNMLNADNLVAIADDTSKFCMYKMPVVTALFIFFTLFAIGTSMTCLGLSSFIIVRSQRTANEVSVMHTVALVNRLKSNIVSYYMTGMVAFFLALILYVWMFIGQSNWIPLPGERRGSETVWATGTMQNSKTCPLSVSQMTGNPACDSYMANGWDVPVLTTDTNQMLVTCLNPFNSTHQAMQLAVNGGIAGVAFGIAFVIVVIAGVSFYRVERAFRRMVFISEMASSERHQPSEPKPVDNIQMLPPSGRSI